MTQRAGVFKQRRGGILLHLTSLPSGTIGIDAYRFIDFLHECGLSVWQMLPLGPTHEDGSPYQCLSAYAVDKQFICKQTILAQDWASTLNLPPDDPAFFHYAYHAFDRDADVRQKNAFDAFT